jgi:hypothetical protein
MGIIPNCKDPTLTAIKSKGYNVVRLPRVDMAPTQLLVANGKTLQRLGDLLSVFVPDPNGPPPAAISPDRPGPNIQGTKSSEIGLDIGLNILGGLIAALGGSQIGINFAYKQARSVQFEFGSTLENSAQLAQIDAFLASAAINPFARAVAQMLEADKVFVVTSTLKSATLTVGAKDSQNQSLGLDVPAIQNAVGGNLKVTSAASDNSVVTYQGSAPLVFGFQAVQLVFDNGKYRTMKLIDAGSRVAEAVAIGTVEGPAAASADAPAMLEIDAML